MARPTCPIHFGTYNIWNGQNGGLESVLSIISKAIMDLGVFQETKLTKHVCVHDSSCYKVLATEALIVHSGGLSLFYRTVEHLFFEEFQTHGANVVSIQLASGDRQWYIMGFYLAPDDASTIEDAVAAIGMQPRGSALLVVGNLNTNLAALEGRERYEGVAVALA